MANPVALSRFTPGYVAGASTTEAKTTIKTNLAGEPIRFSFNETLTNIVSSGTLTLLNAKYNELDDLQVGVLGPDNTYTPEEISDYIDQIAEEDAAMWGTITPDATVEPNQLVEVWEIVGDYTSNLNPETGLTEYTSEEGQTAHTYWRVVSFVAYVDENGVPYCDVTLESLAQIAIDATVSPLQLGAKQDNSCIYVSNIPQSEGVSGYWDSIMYYNEKQTTEIDGYKIDDSVAIANPELDDARIIINSPDEYLTKFFDVIKGLGFNFTGDPPELTRIPLVKEFTKGTSCWQTIEDILGMNGISARFTRSKEFVYWNTASSDAPLGQLDLGAFGTGLKVSFGKEGVFTTAVVTGYLGVKDEASGYWIPKANKVTEVKVTSSAAQNILNTTEEISQSFEVSADYLLGSEDDLKAWGQKELYKALIAARGATADSEGFPLSTEVGMRVFGTSQVAGTVALLVTSYSRTVDAQQNTISHNIGGTILSMVSDSMGGWID